MKQPTASMKKLAVGKGMVICIDKVTAVKMYDKVHKYWKA